MGNIKHPPSFGRIIDRIHQRLSTLERTYAFPRYTTATLPDATLMEGQIVYDTTAKTWKGSNGTTWVALA